MPPVIVILSASKFCRAPLPKPNLLRDKSASISLLVISTWAGIPSTIADKAGPWDSPAVNQRNTLSPLKFDGSILSDLALILRSINPYNSGIFVK